MNSKEGPIVIEQEFNAPLITVWNAITQVDQMKKWYFENIESFVAKVGFETEFNVKSHERDFLHMWKILEVDPLKRIVYNWKYKNITGNSIVKFELSEQGDQTLLILTHTITEAFPTDIPEFKRQSGVDGWKYFITNSLKSYIEKTTK